MEVSTATWDFAKNILNENQLTQLRFNIKHSLKNNKYQLYHLQTILPDF